MAKQTIMHLERFILWVHFYNILEMTKLWKWRTDVAIKGQHERSLWWWNVLYLDCININILVVALYYSFAICYHWEKLGKGYTVLFLTTVCECTMILVKFWIKEKGYTHIHTHLWVYFWLCTFRNYNHVTSCSGFYHEKKPQLFSKS